MLAARRTDLVTLDYALYRKRFSVTAVPIMRKITDRDGNTIIFVKVDRLKAIAFLKNRHEFTTRTEMIAELAEAAEDFKEVREI